MARPRTPIQVISKLQRSGKKYFYALFHDPETGRHAVKSLDIEDDGTRRSRAMADKKANDLLNADLEIIIKQSPRFGRLAASFWDWDKSEYIRARRIRDPKALSMEHCSNLHGYMQRWALPALQDYPVDKLTTGILDTWATGLLKGLAHQTVKHCIASVSGVLDQACRDGLIPFNPVKNMMPLAARNKVHGTFTLEEIRALLMPDNFAKVWGKSSASHPDYDPRRHHAMNLLAAAVGARWNELAPLRAEDFEKIVYQGQVFWELNIHRSLGRISGIKEGTKTGEGRRVPVAEEIMKIILAIMPKEGLLFPGRDPAKPVTHHTSNMTLLKALEAIGITRAEQQARKLGFHSWRHCFTTSARAAAVPDAVVMTITEHKTDKMKELYTHFRAQDLLQALPVQRALLDMEQDPNREPAITSMKASSTSLQ